MAKIVLPQMIDYYRKQNNLTMEQLGDKLGKTKSAISRWISGNRSPMVDDLERLSTLFGVDVKNLMYGASEKDELITKTDKVMRVLVPDRQQNVYNYADDQLKEQQASNVIAMPTPDDDVDEVSANGVLSAGVGEWLDGLDGGFMVKVKKPLPASYDYVFQINGHSMEPYFKDKQVVFVEAHEEYRTGQFVAVIVDGCAYLKRLDCDGEMMILESLNPDYPDIKVYEDDDYHILGVVFA